MSKKNSMTLACMMIFFSNRNSNLQKTTGKIYQNVGKIYQKCWRSKETVMRRERKIMGCENYVHPVRDRYASIKDICISQDQENIPIKNEKGT